MNSCWRTPRNMNFFWTKLNSSTVYLSPLILLNVQLVLWIKWHKSNVVDLLNVSVLRIRRNLNHFFLSLMRMVTNRTTYCCSTEQNHFEVQKQQRLYSKLAWDLSLFIHLNLLIFQNHNLYNAKWLAEQDFNQKLNEAVNWEGKSK